MIIHKFLKCPIVKRDEGWSCVKGAKNCENLTSRGIEIDSAQVTRSDPRDFPAPRLYGLICMWWLEVKKKSCFEFLSREALTSGNSCLLRLKVHEHSWWGVAWGSVVDNWLNTMVLLNLYQSDWTFLTSWGREGRALACVAMLCMVWTN